MSSFKALIRLHKWELDERQRQLSELDLLAARLHDEEQRLVAELAAEQASASQTMEGVFAYANYARAVMARRETLERSIRDVEEQMAQARDELAEAFAELKKYELAAEAEARRAVAKAARVEQIAMDEIALSMFRRRNAGE